ncbi:hypothetical protein, partial [Pseudonocardia pini]|uniref:hypothetical protein n=1 Tax=Pseudonocardia pini TaxID=2758030 RepID=UPI001C68853C
MAPPVRIAREIAVNALLVLVAGGIGAVTVVREPPSGAWGVVTVVLGVLGFAAVFWRRRARFAFGLLAVLVGAVSLLATYLPLIGVYTVASGRRWREIVPVMVLALLGAVVTLTLRVPDAGTRLTLLVGAVGL